MPAITGTWTSLPESDFYALLRPSQPELGYLHFRDQDLATGPIWYKDPITGNILTGQRVRDIITAQAATHGWPLIGIYISGSGQQAAHCALHRSQFPTNPAKKPDRLQNDLDAAMERIYKWEVNDEGNIYDVRQFWVVTHVWNYRQDQLYTPRQMNHTGDYLVQVSETVPGIWWTYAD